jgi:hydrogenase 3 maturation protease
VSSSWASGIPTRATTGPDRPWRRRWPRDKPRRETPESRTSEIRRFGPELTIIVDAAIGGHLPGTVYIVEREKIADEGISTHNISLLYLVRYLEESIGSRVIVLGVEPLTLDLGAPMSPEVRHAVERIVSELSLRFEKIP